MQVNRITVAQLSEMLSLQDAGNRVMAGPDWVTRGYAYARAAYIEMVELVCHLDRWKWWKAPSAKDSVEQIRYELVDIMHFMLSWWIVRFGQPVGSEALTTAVMRRIDLACEGLTFEPFDASKADAVHDAADRFIAKAAAGVIDAAEFFRICAAFDLTPARLHTMYVAKAALNLHRQAFGYKAGHYIKILDGKEDNEALEVIVAQIARDGVAVEIRELTCRLRDWYVEATEREGWVVVDVPADGRAFSLVTARECPEGVRAIPVAGFQGRF